MKNISTRKCHNISLHAIFDTRFFLGLLLVLADGRAKKSSVGKDEQQTQINNDRNAHQTCLFPPYLHEKFTNNFRKELDVTACEMMHTRTRVVYEEHTHVLQMHYC